MSSRTSPDIVLNLKKVKFAHNDKEPRILSIKVEKDGVIKAGDIQGDNIYDVVNKNQVICTLDKEGEVRLRVRGSRSAVVSPPAMRTSARISRSALSPSIPFSPR